MLCERYRENLGQTACNDGLYYTLACHCVQIKELISKPLNPVSKPILKVRLSDKQWEAVQFINHALRQEYECRRQMLLQRLDVTILSFQWADKGKVRILSLNYMIILLGESHPCTIVLNSNICVRKF